MIVSLIVAMDEKGGIGIENRLPWRLPDDLQRLKFLTMGHHIIMGRKTHESIGRALLGRINIVVTRNPAYQAEGCQVVHSVTEALALAEKNGEQEAFIFGGESIFAEAFPLAQRIYLTRVHANTPTDVFFPAFNASEWEVIHSSHHEADDRNEFSTTYEVLERKLPHP